mmetsp:Transcript_31240/g.61855  ORF Transcript_31240/g.61855 Transcript_31240/m.61855 type:complete len:128 (-) Transcript_31240:404-787(-)
MRAKGRAKGEGRVRAKRQAKAEEQTRGEQGSSSEKRARNERRAKAKDRVRTEERARRERVQRGGLLPLVLPSFVLLPLTLPPTCPLANARSFSARPSSDCTVAARSPSTACPPTTACSSSGSDEGRG